MEDSALLQAVFYKIFTFPKPVIAKVHGPAIAGGCDQRPATASDG